MLEHTRKNLEAPGQQWDPAWDDQFGQLMKDRWSDVSAVLSAAGFNDNPH